MTREEIIERIKVMQAYINGEKVQYKKNSGKWADTEEPIWSNLIKYRIKPESTYRPFKDAEECLAEMQKHQLFGWVKNQGLYRNIANVMSCSITFADNEARDVNYEQAFKNYTFADGTPFGVKDE